jgi:antitoxin component YwqK of YwqJK toxin-antitoxin module
LFLEKANEIAISTFGSPIKELDDLMFSFDKNNLSVFKFEAELENGMEVSIQTVDGVVVIEAEDEEKFKGGGSVKTLPTFDNIPKDKSWAKWVAQHKDGEWWYYDASPRLVENVGWKNSDRDGFQMPSGITTDSKGWDSRAYLLDKATGKIMKQGGNLDLANDTYYVKNENIKLVKYKNGKEVYNWEYWYGTDADNKDEVFSGLVVAKSPITDPNQYSMFKAGGKLPEDAMYIKRSDINSVIIYDEKTGNEVEIPSNKIVSGIWFDNTRTQILIDKAKKEGLLSENKKKNKK